MLNAVRLLSGKFGFSLQYYRFIFDTGMNDEHVKSIIKPINRKAKLFPSFTIFLKFWQEISPTFVMFFSHFSCSRSCMS